MVGSARCADRTPQRGVFTSLPFRELETFPGAGLSGFFSLFHARIAAKQTLRLKQAAQIGIDLKKRARNGQLRCAGLSHRAPAAGVNPQIVSVYRFGGLKRLENHVLQRHSWKIIFEAASIDIDLSATRRHANARDGCFAASCGDEFFSFWHKTTICSC